MVFSSIVFICIFLPVIFILYTLLPSIKVKNILLVAASLVFYAYGEPVYIILMLLSTVANYLFGLLLDKYKNKNSGRLILIVAVIANLTLLGVYKYADMICGLVSDIFKIKIQSPGLALPIGISFYTFQAMSYIIDVYRDEVKAQRNYLNVLLYISFFPQLIAGPIVKYHDIEKQIQSRKQKSEDVARGLRRFIIGLSKKVLISNVLAVAADNIFSLDIYQVNICSAWIGAIAYMLQIYYDFSGYSDMAIGLGHMFGFSFSENFKYPYASVSIRDFWRRWHISLSTWFKEYLYIPLGGNRKGRVRGWINRLIVFFCTGLWHGANWTFVLWGIYHGVLLFFEDVIRNSGLKVVLPNIIKRIYT
ncbi:MAG: MBOAT family protein, partial [Lachnospiraceae bacterium]|nr:MBOAT family protein [Lachnospiraceae bacterium]